MICFLHYLSMAGEYIYSPPPPRWLKNIFYDLLFMISAAEYGTSLSINRMDDFESVQYLFVHIFILLFIMLKLLTDLNTGDDRFTTKLPFSQQRKGCYCQIALNNMRTNSMVKVGVSYSAKETVQNAA